MSDEYSDYEDFVCDECGEVWSETFEDFADRNYECPYCGAV